MFVCEIYLHICTVELSMQFSYDRKYTLSGTNWGSLDCQIELLCSPSLSEVPAGLCINNCHALVHWQYPNSRGTQYHVHIYIMHTRMGYEMDIPDEVMHFRWLAVVHMYKHTHMHTCFIIVPVSHANWSPSLCHTFVCYYIDMVYTSLSHTTPTTWLYPHHHGSMLPLCMGQPVHSAVE